MKTKLIVCITVIIGLLLVDLKQANAQTPPPSYVVVDLGTLGGPESYANGINNNGQVVGSSYISGNNYQHAFLYSGGSMRDLGTLNADNYSEAYGINDSGQVVGYSAYYLAQASQYVHAFRYSNGSMTDLGTLGGRSGGAYGINDGGQVVGWASINGNTAAHAFLYSNGSMTDLGILGGSESYAYGINNNGQVVGDSHLHAFLYSNGSMIDLGTLGGNQSFGQGINDVGQVVGYSDVDNTIQRAFLYSNGSMVSLGSLGGYISRGNGINNGGQVVGVSEINGHGAWHTFLYSGGTMYDLNNLTTAPIGWLLIEANGINDRGQIAGYGRSPPGEYHAVRLDPLPTGWRQTIEAQPMQPTYGTCPVKEPGKDSLIVVTHGWNPDVTWVESMTNTIQMYVDSHSLNNWKVIAYKWVEKATALLPDTALNNAVQEGRNLGKCLRAQNWDHIHFIAHSAGSALIQTATDTIKDLASGTPPGTVIHTTFLDAYVGLVYGGKGKYGQNANWSDNYFSRDKETLGEFYNFTEGSLDHCYNVDVTWLDSNKSTLNVYYSSGSGGLQTCLRTITSHAWPHVFYQNTIPPNSMEPESAGFGFLLSKEVGGWNSAISHIPGNDPPETLGTPDLPCAISYGSTPAVIGPTVNFAGTPSQQSPTGLIYKGNGDIKLTTDSPAWLATFLTLTNPANLVSFDAEFTSTNGAQGLLSVYWDTNSLGTVDERIVQSGFQRYSFGFPRTTGDSTHLLGFRLDPFTNIQSSVIITNVSIGLAGVSEPFTLSVTGMTNGTQVMQLTGPAGYTYSVELSSNLINWSVMAMLANTNGIVRFLDTESTNAPMRFYRAVTP